MTSFESNTETEPSVPHEAASTRRIPSKYVYAGGASISILILIIIAGVAQLSLPGTALYPLKTNVIEAGIGLFHPYSADSANYHVTLLTHRLDEAKALSQKTNVSEAALVAITTETEKNWTDFALIASTSIDSAFPKTELLRTVNEFTSVATAIENISENNVNLVPYGDAVEDIRQDAVRLYKDRAESFVATEVPATVYTYITDELASVATMLDTPDITQPTMRSARNYLDRTETAIGDSDLTKAVISIGEAYRIIQSFHYSGEIIKLVSPDTITTDTATSTEPTNPQATTSTTTNN